MQENILIVWNSHLQGAQDKNFPFQPTISDTGYSKMNIMCENLEIPIF